MARKQVNVRLEEGDLKRIHNTGISQSDLIRDAVTYYLDNELWLSGAKDTVAVCIQTLSKRIAELENKVKEFENAPQTYSKMGYTAPQTHPTCIQPTSNAYVAQQGGRDYEAIINQILDDLGEVSKATLESTNLTNYGTFGGVKSFLDKLRPMLRVMTEGGDLIESTGAHGAKIWKRSPKNELMER